MMDNMFKPVPPHELLHDNNSKVWIIQEDLDGEKDYAPYHRKDKHTLLFFETGEFYLQKLSDWGSDNFIHGKYVLKSDEITKEITLAHNFENQPGQTFKVVVYQHNRFELEFIGDNSRRLVLVPITKPH
jgi:hypothetical protein